MTNTLEITRTDENFPTVVSTWLENIDATKTSLAVGSFLDTATTATGRATHYNTRQEQIEMLTKIHGEILAIDRGLYALLNCLDGVNDLSIQTAVQALLNNPRSSGQDFLLNPEQEGLALAYLIGKLPPQRMLKLYRSFVAKRVNNARARKLIFRTLLHQPVSKLEHWAVTYREKLKIALKHALGERKASILASILGKQRRTEKEHNIVRKSVGKYIAESLQCGPSTDEYRREMKGRLEVVGFVLGSEKNLTLNKLQSFVEVKEGHWESGSVLPEETLEGLRSVYHKGRERKTVIEMTKRNMSKGKRINIQKSAAKHGVEVEFNPYQHEAVKLYVYAYEQGITDDIVSALAQKARKAAATMTVSFDKIGIVLDNSASMFGHGSQKNRPISIALATRDMLKAAVPDCKVIMTSQQSGRNSQRLPKPKGDTSLARALVEILQEDVEAVFVITDGYENAPAGRFAEVMKIAREKLRIETPVYQVSPVSAAEASAIKTLAPGLAPAMPVSSPNKLGTAFVKMVLDQDPERGLRSLVGLGMKQLTYDGRE